ncbi:MAG: hypothetical protein PVG92_04795, partial [Holophagae bacterium]
MNLDRLQSCTLVIRLAFVGVTALGLVSMPADLEAQQQPTADSPVATADETTKNQKVENVKEDTKGPSFIPIPIFIT